MFRLIFLTFHGKQRYDEHHVHVHESPWSMLGPLVILAILSIVGGWLAAPAFLPGGTDHFANFLAPVFGGAHVATQEQGLSPHFRDRPGRCETLLLIDIEQDHRPSHFGHTERDASSDSRRRPGNHRNLSIQRQQFDGSFGYL